MTLIALWISSNDAVFDLGITRHVGRFIGAASLIAAASGQATSPAIDIKVIAEVTARITDEGGDSQRLLPATRVVPGDEVIYTVEIRNIGTHDAVSPTIVRPVPEHMAYIADSATGPGAEVTYSVDGGHTFERPEFLSVRGADARLRPAIALDYTHIRWQLKKTLKAKSVAFARFRAVVK